MISMMSLLAVLMLFAAPAEAPTQGTSYASVVRELEHPDAKRRVSALRQLREAGYLEAAVPVAKLLTDPAEDVQVEAINVEVSFFLNERLRPRSRVGLVVEVRGSSIAQLAFDRGPAVVRPEVVPVEVIKGLIAATDAPGRRARVEAVYALGVLARPAPTGTAATLREAIQALGARLGYQMPAQRVAAAEVLGRLYHVCGATCAPSGDDAVGDALIGALNDPDQDVQAAATYALGALRYDRALTSLADRLAYFRSGTMARLTLDALARVGHPSSLALFKARLVDRDPAMRRVAHEGIARVGDAVALGEAEATAGVDRVEQVLLAAAFSQQRNGRADRLDDIIRALDTPALKDQASGYLVELGQPAVERLARALPAASSRARLEGAAILTQTGTPAAATALEALKSDPDPRVVAAAQNALAWIKARTVR